MIALLIGALRLVRRSASGRLVVVLAFAPIVAAATAWAAGVPIFDLRNLIGVGPYIAVLTVVLLDTTSRRVSLVGASAVVVAIGISVIVSNVARIPAYDAMARSLVLNGWNPSRPIAVFGDPYRYRLPFEWYLPRQPVLDMSHLLTESCTEILVVTPRGKVRRERLRAPLSSDLTLRRATLLVDPAARPSCVSHRGSRSRAAV